MATSPNYGWLEPDNTDLVKNGALAIRTLGNAIDTTMATMTPKSLVDAKGDLIAASANDTPARLAVGNNGETLVANSSTSTGLAWSGTNTQNPVINGSQDIWQRGTSFTTSGYTSDRWYWNVFSIAGRTLSRQVPGSTLPEFSYCARSARNSGNTATDPIAFVNSFAIEEAQQYAGKTVTVSFYARAGANYSATSNILQVYLVTGTGTSDVQRATTTYTGDNTSLSTNVTLTTSWQRFTYTATMPSTMTQFCIYLNHAPTGTAGANDWYEVTGTQIDIGSTATPFRRAGGTIQGELAACQRYYWRTGGSTLYARLTDFSPAISATSLFAQARNPVAMRVTPSVVDYSTLTTYDNVNIGVAISSIVISSDSTPYISYMTVTTTGLTQYRPYQLMNYGSTSAYLGFSAEL